MNHVNTDNKSNSGSGGDDGEGIDNLVGLIEPEGAINVLNNCMEPGDPEEDGKFEEDDDVISALITMREAK